MTTKQIILFSVVALLAAFAVGRWSAPEKIKTVTVTVEKKTEDKVVDIDKHKVTTITEVSKPDGTKTKTTVIADNSTTDIHDKIIESVSQTQTKEVDKTSSKVTISVLAAVNLSNIGAPNFGISITKPILGPLTVGLFGFQDKTVGASVGLTF